MNLFASSNELDANPSTGVLDSVMIAYDDLRIVNSKLIELEYEKEINSKLRSIVYNDSIFIQHEKTINKQISIECKKVTKQRDVCFVAAIVTILIGLISFLK